ncbi:MAG: hypothetical protein IJN79_02715 [Clostridia bacterium]|nr:hypothetical protein [Clostridia bacterium]MBQ2948720.1 hypothetical protein [Clostridia bacterium]MBQ4609793.1 hypothetical protein [Clostridia bacterium]MBQ6859301.1 hypothetical protein [Clostridia bacterium]MBQ7051696.1 hypothetical protein [Clostridia bacterium]
MKSFLRLFYVLVVAIVVFVGALLIAQGAREQEEKRAEEQRAAEQAQARKNLVSDILDAMFSNGEGSAL